MNIYKVSRTDSWAHGYDEYDSFVCAAESEQTARDFVPGNDRHAWVLEDNISSLDVVLLGTAIDNFESGIILASFNAG